MRVLALASLLLLASGACADDEIVERAIAIRAGKFYPETVEVPAGRKIRLVVTNEGPGPEEFESTPLKKETVLAEGVTRKIIIAPQDPGEYPFFGEFHLDTAQGRLVVR